VLRFREKPDADTAAGFVASGRFFWNSGMFFWRLATFLRELATAQPAMHAALFGIAEALRTGDTGRASALFETVDNVAIDYALMERSRSLLVIPATFAWDDIGAWDAMERIHTPDAAGNVTAGAPVVIDSRNCTVLNDAGGTAVAVVGLADVAVIVTRDAVLVARKESLQQVRDAVAELNRRGAGHT
jgi:mannose-1-phosphate guanylyltransferase